MGVMNRFLNFVGLQDEEEIVERDTRPMEEAEDHETVSADARKSNKGNIVSIHSQRNVRVVLNEPRSYEETQEIADHLRSRRPVVVNLQRVRTEQAIRIVDFLSGTVYALNGGITKIGPNIFLCTPDSVEIQGAISEMMHDQDEFNR
ncbi:cell division protein SepF [Paenibacillus hemerocallicola]|uniref:Cell division protein SepF n=1 Tax=Paenibacillus hemerocallicola TaxID=1172614 RepID=A0A5C4TB99_9BACL|nr:cell division protein SepF [Paenibacillus hemerocallicola]TNJ66354.1 cell division protein SepF [Paenibacillus hemerocallicola]